MKSIITVLLVCFIAIPVLSQEPAAENKAISNGRIITTDSKMINGQYLVIGKDSVEFYEKGNPARFAIPLSQVDQIQEFKGNWGNTGMWIGCLVGCGIGVAVALGTEETTTTGYFQETTIQTWPIYLIGLGGTLVGYLIGRSAEDYDTVYSRSTSFLKNLDIYMDKEFNSVHLAYKIKF